MQDLAHQLAGNAGFFGSNPEHPFGLCDAKRMATAFRDFADRIEGGEVAPQEFRIISRGTVDDFLMETLLFRFHRKRVTVKSVSLYGPNQWPHAIAEVQGPKGRGPADV